MSFNKDLYENTDASGLGFEKIVPHIAVCEIIDVTDINDKQLLKIKFDIIDGKFKNYYREQEKQFGEYPSDGYHYRSYKDTAMPFFKGFITAIEKSNANYDFSKTYEFAPLKGKKFAGIFEQEEIPFTDDDGNIIVKTRLTKVGSLLKMQQGELKFSTEIKRLSDKDKEKLTSENLKTDEHTEAIVQERLNAKEKDTFYEASKKLASEEDLPF